MVEVTAHGYLRNRKLGEDKSVLFVYLNGCEEGIGLMQYNSN